MIFRLIRQKMRTTQTKYFFSKFTHHSLSSQLPSFYDINVSLQSNIQKRKKISQVLTLHQMMRSYYTPSHIAKSMRVITQIIDKQRASRGRMHTKQPFIFKQQLKDWKELFLDLWSVRGQKLSTDDKIDFLHFIYKTAQYRISLKTIQYSYSIELAKFRIFLIKRIIDPQEIQEFKLPQLAVILNYMLVIRQQPQHLQTVLLQLQKQLNEKNTCILMHLILVAKTLKECSQNVAYNSLDKAIIENVKKLTANAIASQISHVFKYLDIVAIVQLYNVLKQDYQHSSILRSQAVELLPQLLQIENNLAFQSKELSLFFSELQRTEDIDSGAKKLLKEIRAKLSARGKFSELSMTPEKSKSTDDEMP